MMVSSFYPPFYQELMVSLETTAQQLQHSPFRKKQLSQDFFFKKPLFYFSQGLIGFEKQHFFTLISLEKEVLAPLCFLQSVEDQNLRLFGLATTLKHPWIEEKDRQEILSKGLAETNEDGTVFLGRFQKNASTQQLVFNLNAPVILNNASQKGHQYITQYNKTSKLYFSALEEIPQH